MSRVAHVIGNGDNAVLYKPTKGIKVTCNVPPFAVEGVYTTCLVDFKMMKAMTEGSVTIPGEWTLGYRPKVWMQNNPNFYMKVAQQIKGFYLTLPKYVTNYTDFNCGHMAAHYTANELQADEIHMYGFDSIFDFNLRSSTDLFLNSDRSLTNNNRLVNNWRPVWLNLFNEFPTKQFILYHKHGDVKIILPDNVEVRSKS
tara:strand:+ start:2357 stop:2953 length:597 start_codon:yes stop_codon:yes gene_type:complete